jgi:hypothetical protein
MNKILIFDTFSGLCNQFYDISNGINFCIINNIKFTFRFCSFRNSDLTSWYNVKFEELFDNTFLKKYENLYINYDDIKDLNNNVCNFSDTKYNENENLLNHILNINKKYIN